MVERRPRTCTALLALAEQEERGYAPAVAPSTAWSSFIASHRAWRTPRACVDPAALVFCASLGRLPQYGSSQSEWSSVLRLIVEYGRPSTRCSCCIGELIVPGTEYVGTIAIPSFETVGGRKPYRLSVTAEAPSDGLERVVRPQHRFMGRHNAYDDEQGVEIVVDAIDRAAAPGATASVATPAEYSLSYADYETCCAGVVRGGTIAGSVSQLEQGRNGFFYPAEEVTHTFDLELVVGEPQAADGDDGGATPRAARCAARQRLHDWARDAERARALARLGLAAQTELRRVDIAAHVSWLRETVASQWFPPLATATSATDALGRIESLSTWFDDTTSDDAHLPVLADAAAVPPAIRAVARAQDASNGEGAAERLTQLLFFLQDERVLPPGIDVRNEENARWLTTLRAHLAVAEPLRSLARIPEAYTSATAAMLAAEDLCARMRREARVATEATFASAAERDERLEKLTTRAEWHAQCGVACRDVFGVGFLCGYRLFKHFFADRGATEPAGGSYRYYLSMFGETARLRLDNSFARVDAALRAAETRLPTCWFTPFEARGDGVTACVICMEAPSAAEETIRLPCSHSFHSDCVKGWLHGNTTCPVCRRELSRVVHTT